MTEKLKIIMLTLNNLHRCSGRVMRILCKHVVGNNNTMRR